jgi:hypothetical protein
MSAYARVIILGLIMGLVSGLGFGIYLQPVRYYNTAPSTLRADYRADYILMVAQSFSGERDSGLALQRLAALGPKDVASLLEQAIAYAREHDYPEGDMHLLEALASAMAAIPPTPEIQAP